MFAFQIYGDFSGYSDIAIGTSRLFGFDLKRNFHFPYFSRDIAEFWRRWHISLSTWFRDYLYIPLGGSRVGQGKKIRNIFVIFLVSGFWHGANWTFIIWGALNTLYFLLLLLSNRNRNNLETVVLNKLFPTLREAFSILLTFGLTILDWVFFRAQSVGAAFDYLGGIFSSSLLTAPDIAMWDIYIILALFVAVEWIGRNREYAIENINVKLASRPVRWSAYVAIVYLIFYVGYFGDTTFIYFQF